ncbi:MAG: hypothetical protein ACFB10_19490 [Salibacteraceae bacterium]
MLLEFKRLSEIDPSKFIDWMNHPQVRKPIPLLQGNFTEAD